VKYLISIIALLLSPYCLSDSGEQKMEGYYQIGGKFSYDSKAPLKGNSHLYMTITGDAAKNLYNSLLGNPENNECTGELDKATTKFSCSKTISNNYYCSFSIDLGAGTVEAGLGGCI